MELKRLKPILKKSKRELKTSLNKSYQPVNSLNLCQIPKLKLQARIFGRDTLFWALRDGLYILVIFTEKLDGRKQKKLRAGDKKYRPSLYTPLY